ncbi:Uncharacterized protein HZ326_27302 [Fusarium oxysporum f. sp. albedinis]|nr:Uncharacterized protein HZ326_27302 [Fusarium oxysporum f. sp. albedinis]
MTDLLNEKTDGFMIDTQLPEEIGPLSPEVTIASLSSSRDRLSMKKAMKKKRKRKKYFLLSMWHVLMNWRCPHRRRAFLTSYQHPLCTVSPPRPARINTTLNFTIPFEISSEKKEQQQNPAIGPQKTQIHYDLY